MNGKKQSYPKPLPQRPSRHRPGGRPGASEGSRGWMVIFIVVLAFVAMLVLALGGGRT